jgi:hypothetical protein
MIALQTDWGRIVGVVPTDAKGQLLSQWGWGGFAFSPDERSFFATWRSPTAGVTTLARVDLAGALAHPVSFFATTVPETRPLLTPGGLDGFSRGCPVFFEQLTGLWRSCDACDELPILPKAASVVVSPDGGFALSDDSYPAYTTTLWSLPPDPRPVRVFGPRVDSEVVGGVEEQPIAVTAGGARLLLGGGAAGASCYFGPELTVQVLDSQTGELLDDLPPRPSAVDDEATRILYRTGDVWCERQPGN